jgi:hypothetical protein
LKAVNQLNCLPLSPRKIPMDAENQRLVGYLEHTIQQKFHCIQAEQGGSHL